MIEAKLFVGQPEKVERAFNRWSGEQPAVVVLSIMPLRAADGEVGFMILFQPAQQQQQSGKIVPAASIVH